MSCEDCFKTVQHSGTPLGKTETIAGVPTYVSEPNDAGAQKKILLFFSDVFSPFYINNQLIQDYFASHGFTVLGLDYFFGDRMETLVKDPAFKREVWRGKVVKDAMEHTPKWVEAVRERYGTDVKYCAAGYCFGAPYVFALANDASFNLAAGAVIHPSSLLDHDTKALKADIIESCVAPMLFSCAEIDAAFPAEARRQTEDILVKKKAEYYFQIFSGVSHGFGSRGDPSVDAQRWAKEESARGVLEWFKRFTA
ncbi:Alpha/Beta hydrolase protein [Melanogaster broomeanus]|nr:Alpha/Beta hydrolase protein [Melanogaster broomeanus]